LAERTPSGAYYYLFDGQGSVLGITDSSGGVVARYGDDPFGRLTSMMSVGSVGIDNPWRYVGAYQDGTGLYKMGERFYDPTTGRFTQQDPLVNPLDPSSCNRYAYVGDDPVNFSDPSGHHKCDWLHPWDCAGAVASAVGDAVSCIVGAITPGSFSTGSALIEGGGILTGLGAAAIDYATNEAIAAGVDMIGVALSVTIGSAGLVVVAVGAYLVYEACS
jgi:RHS repeat-associated protein